MPAFTTLVIVQIGGRREELNPGAFLPAALRIYQYQACSRFRCDSVALPANIRPLTVNVKGNGEKTLTCECLPPTIGVHHGDREFMRELLPPDTVTARTGAASEVLRYVPAGGGTALQRGDEAASTRARSSESRARPGEEE